MKIFASKPTKQDIFISVTIFLCGILFSIGILNFIGIRKEIALNIELKKNRSDTTFFYLVYDSIKKHNIIYTYNPRIKNTIIHYYSLEKGIMKIDTINNIAITNKHMYIYGE